MTKSAQVAFLFTLLAGIALSPTLAQGKRSPPAEVPPVSSEGVRYEAPHFNNPCGQNGGCVVAYDAASGALLWSVKVYCTHYDAQLETDVQDVFITSLAVDNAKVDVTNEKGLHFAIDLRTQAVSGDARGCSASSARGCSFAAGARAPRLSHWGILAVVCLVAIMRREPRRGVG